MRFNHSLNGLRAFVEREGETKDDKWISGNEAMQNPDILDIVMDWRSYFFV
jgi:hypothetical protein